MSSSLYQVVGKGNFDTQDDIIGYVLVCTPKIFCPDLPLRQPSSRILSEELPYKSIVRATKIYVEKSSTILNSPRYRRDYDQELR